MFNGKVALVTGGSRGIGLGIAKQLVEHGAKVCLTARKPDQLDEAVAELGGERVAIRVAGSADDPAHRQEAVAAAIERFGSCDILVNNAGINPHYGPMVEGDETVAEKILAVNVVAPFAWSREAWRSWMGEHGGSILNVASFGGVRVSKNLGFYNMSKAALIHLTKQLALELAPTVRVNALAPAVVKTRFASVLYENEDEVLKRYPLDRLGHPEDTASAARFLLSEEASWITGQTIVLDGGNSLT